MGRRTLLHAAMATVLVVGVVGGLAPAADSSHSDWAETIVFDGTASVGPAANGGPGLCLPGLDPQDGCAPLGGPGDLPVPDSTFTFAVPTLFQAPVVSDLPGTCLVAGLADGDEVTPRAAPTRS